MFKLNYIVAAGCMSLAITSNVNAQGYNGQPFMDVTAQENQPSGFQSKGAALRDDSIPDVDMQRISRAFDAGNSEAQDTVLYRVYDAYSSVAVRTRRYMTTLISIPENRTIKQAYAADQFSFNVKLAGKKSPNQVVVEPRSYDVDTNLVITDTDGNIYTFYIRSEPKNSKYVPHFAVYITDPVGGGNNLIRFDAENNPLAPVDDYTEKNGQAVLPEGKLPQRNKLTKKEYDFLRELEASGVVNVNYTMYGERAIAPNAVWDDGNQTYISFRDGTPSQRIPNLYRLVDGYGVIANYHYRDGFIVVDAISEEGWMLIDGTKVVCIKSPNYDERKSMKVEIRDLELQNEASGY